MTGLLRRSGRTTPAPAFAIDVDAASGTVRVSGELDLATSPLLIEALDLLAHVAITTVVLDLSAVEFLDSTGLGALVSIRRTLLAAGRSLRLRDVPANARDLLAVTGLDTVFDVETDHGAGE
jgi:anti-sigma B factor antagonist